VAIVRPEPPDGELRKGGISAWCDGVADWGRPLSSISCSVGSDPICARSDVRRSEHDVSNLTVGMADRASPAHGGVVYWFGRVGVCWSWWRSSRDLGAPL